MPGSNRDKLTRRTLLGASVALASPIAGLSARGAHAQAPARTPTKVLDFLTYADVAKAEQEGEFVYYCHDERGRDRGDRSRRSARTSRRSRPAMCGPRPARCTTRSSPSAPPAASTSTCSSSPTSRPALDFQKKGGYEHLPLAGARRPTSPSTSATRPAHFFWTGVTFAGLAYNDRQGEGRGGAEELEGHARSEVAQRRHELQDLLLGHAVRAVVQLRKLYGDEFWKEFAKQRPRGFDSRAQLFDRLAKGDDSICALAEYAAMCCTRRRARRSSSSRPPTGCRRRRSSSASSTRRRIRRRRSSSSTGRCRTAARRSTRAIRILLYGSLRNDAPPMPTGKRLADFKLLFPTDWTDYLGQPRRVQQGVERDARAVGSAKHAGARAAVAGPRRARPSPASASPAPRRVLVLYPIFYLIQASLDVGDPEARPPTAYGLDNFAGLPQYSADHAQHADRRRRGDRDGAASSAS